MLDVGDLVVCVDDSPCTVEDGDHQVPCPWRRGDTGRVVEAYRHGIRLQPNKSSFPFVSAHRFRKIDAPDTEVSRLIRACKPVREGQPA